MKIADRVKEVTEINWTFGGQIYARMEGWTQVDPFPGYAHDVGLVRKMLRQVERHIKIRHRPTIYVLHYDTQHYTNGWAEMGYGKYDEKTKKQTLAPGKIVLAGKRIPPMPAMTRYLVAHEYGHHVDYNLCNERGLRLDGGLDEEYAKLRKLPEGWDRYGARNWHSNVGELIANDFRVLVCDVEPEFWPHPGYKRPEAVKGLEAWWREAIDA